MPRTVLILLFLGLLFLPPASGGKPKPSIAAGRNAEHLKAPQPIPITTPAKNPCDVVLLMDSSGSMKKTDPRGYRKEAARLFISLLSGDDRIGVVSFGDSAEVVVPLTENRPEHRGRLARSIGAVTSAQLATNITAAVRTGAGLLRSSRRKERVLILMSDGKLALGAPDLDAAAGKELDALLPALKAEGIRVYAIAFTDLADSALLSHIAGKTGGFSRLARSDSDIHLAFSAMFESIKSPDMLPLDNGSFSVDDGVREATVVITKTPGTDTALESPDNAVHRASGRRRASMQWYVSDRFDMVTVQEPSVGVWRVRLSSLKGNSVYVITELSLLCPPEAVLRHPDGRVELQAWLARQGEPLREPGVLDEISMEADITSADGRHMGLVLRRAADQGSRTTDGIYRGVFTPAADGDHEVRLIARSKTFTREKRLVLSLPSPADRAQVPPRPNAGPVSQAVNWTEVLVKFGIVNLCFFGAIIVVVLIRRGLVRRRGNPASGEVRT